MVWETSGQYTGYDVMWRAFDEEGTPRTGEVLVNQSYKSGNQYVESVETLDNGHSIVSWRYSGYTDGNGLLQDTKNNGTYMRELDENGSLVTEETLINTDYTESDQLYSKIAQIDEDRIMVIWASYNEDGSNYGVFGKVYDLTLNSMSDSFQINQTISGHQTTPYIERLDDNSVIIGWNDQGGADGNGYGVFAQILRFEAVEKETRIDNNQTQYKTLPFDISIVSYEIGVSSNGTLHIGQFCVAKSNSGSL